MSKRRIEILIFVLILLAGWIYGYYKYVLSNQLSKIKDYKQKVESSQVSIKTLREIKNNKKGTLDKISVMEKELETLNKAIPDFNNGTDLNLQIYYAIKARGLTMKNLEPQNITMSKGYGYQNISVNVSGKRKNITEFIKFLQDNPREIKINEAVIRLKSIDELEVNLKLQIFFINN